MIKVISPINAIAGLRPFTAPWLDDLCFTIHLDAFEDFRSNGAILWAFLHLGT